MTKRHLVCAGALLLILLSISGCAFYGGYAYYDPPPVYGYFGYYHSYPDGSHQHRGDWGRRDWGRDYRRR